MFEQINCGQSEVLNLSREQCSELPSCEPWNSLGDAPEQRVVAPHCPSSCRAAPFAAEGWSSAHTSFLSRDTHPFPGHVATLTLSCLMIRLFVHRHVTGTSGFCTCASPSPQSPRRGPGQKEICQRGPGRPNRAHTHQPGHSRHKLLCRQPFLASPTEFIFYFELALEVLLRSPQEPR